VAVASPVSSPASISAHRRIASRPATPVGATDLVKPSRGEIAIILIAVLLAVLGFNYGQPLTETTNLLVPILLIIGQVYGIVSLISRSYENIWTPLLWNRVAFIFYFGVGSLVPGFVNNETLDLIEGFYSFFSDDVAKYNLVNALFAFVFLIASGFILSSAQNVTSKSRIKIDACAFDRRFLGLVLIAVGSFVYFGILLDAGLGVPDALSSLFLTQIAQGTYVGIFLLASWAIANRSPWLYFAQAFTVLLFVMGLVLLSKTEALLPVIMLGLAYIYERKSIRTTIVGAAAVYLVFVAITDPVSHARSEAGTPANGIGFGAQSVGERIQLYRSYRLGSGAGTDDEIQIGWARLSYVNGGTFAINQYDAGIPGSSFEYLPIVWLPRIIYPSKPNLTDKARDFNFAVAGSDSSQSTPGMPSEGYWNYGWLGVVGLAAVSSMIFAIWSFYTVVALQNGAWHLLLVILLGMRVGTRVDGMFVTDIFGPVGYAILGHFVLTFLNRLILRRRERLQRPHRLAKA
jgi:hypothetical protein